MSPDGKLILIAEDEEAMAGLLMRRLEKAGYRTRLAQDGAQALHLAGRAGREKPDLLLLDRMLPVFDGIEICRRLRATQHGREMAILFLSARGEVADRISGLESGADDYLAKPFVMEEMLARVRALLRRGDAGAEEGELICGGFAADLPRHEMSYKDRAVMVGRIGFALMAHMMKRPGHIYSRAQLLDAVWGTQAILEERTVDVHISRLRRALKAGGAPMPVRAARGLGYVFRPFNKPANK